MSTSINTEVLIILITDMLKLPNLLSICEASAADEQHGKVLNVVEHQ